MNHINHIFKRGNIVSINKLHKNIDLFDDFLYMFFNCYIYYLQNPLAVIIDNYANLNADSSNQYNIDIINIKKNLYRLLVINDINNNNPESYIYYKYYYLPNSILLPYCSNSTNGINFINNYINHNINNKKIIDELIDNYPYNDKSLLTIHELNNKFLIS